MKKTKIAAVTAVQSDERKGRVRRSTTKFAERIQGDRQKKQLFNEALIDAIFKWIVDKNKQTAQKAGLIAKEILKDQIEPIHMDKFATLQLLILAYKRSPVKFDGLVMYDCPTVDELALRIDLILDGSEDLDACLDKALVWAIPMPLKDSFGNFYQLIYPSKN